MAFTPKGLYATAQGRASRTLGNPILPEPTPKGLYMASYGPLYNPFGVSVDGDQRTQGARSATLGCGIQPLRGKYKSCSHFVGFGRPEEIAPTAVYCTPPTPRGTADPAISLTNLHPLIR